MTRLNKNFFDLVWQASIAGCLTGASVGIVLALTLTIFSRPFLQQTGHFTLILAYVIAYMTVLMFLCFTAVQAVVYLAAKLILKRRQSWFQKITALIPAAFPGTTFFLAVTPYLIFYVFDGLFNSKLLTLIVAAGLIAILVSFKWRALTTEFIDSMKRHSCIPVSLLPIFLLTIAAFWMFFPSTPYPQYDLQIIESLQQADYHNNPVPRNPQKSAALPNIVLISIETLRADHVSAYGYNRKISPNIDDFATDNVRFKTCYVASPGTIVNLTALLTSAFPGETGVYAQSHELAAEDTTITELLRKKGYTTIGIVSNYLLPYETGIGMAQGFDYYINYGDEYKTSSPKITKNAISKIKQAKAPFFIWLHYFDPHAPYGPPKDFYKKVGRMEQVEHAEQKFPLIDYGSTAGVKRARIGDAYRLPENTKKITKGYVSDLYDAEIFYVDYEVGRVLDFLKKNNQFEDSLTIITADHGESLVEHSLYCQHCLDLYQESALVPLLVHLPHSPQKNIVVDSLVNTIDIAPTILELTDVPVPNHFRGNSLLRYLNPNTNPKNRAFVLMTAWWDGVSLKFRKMARQHPDFAIVSNGYKYIVHSMDSCLVRSPLEMINLWRDSLTKTLLPDEMYRLDTDPLEKSDLKKDDPQLAKDLKQRIYSSREFTSYIKLREEGALTEVSNELTEQQIEKLKSLGYL